MSSVSKNSLSVEERREQAWNMHIKGADQWTIARALGVNQSAVCRYIKAAAAKNPTVSLSDDERSALAEAKWNQGEDEIREQIELQRTNGRITKEVIQFPDGTQQTKETFVKGVDPALLRTLSTHTDRRNRQAMNQAGSDAPVQAVNVSIVKDFLNQAQTNGRLSPEEWNDRQRTVDI